jgi:aerobic carbon-monoxide dehydrogenase medium subunit
MSLPAFDYAAPTTLQEAIELLAAGEGGALALAGGQSLMPLLAFRLAAPSLLVDLQKVPGLGDIGIDEGGVRIGARVRWCELERETRLAEAHPLLQEAVHHIAHYQIRNRGTVGGSLAHADPAAELPGLAVGCRAGIVVASRAGRRTIPAAQFFVGPLQTVLQPGELIVELSLPPWRPGRRFAFEEVSRRKGDFAMAGVALHFDLDEALCAHNVNVGAIGVGDTPLRLAAVEKVLEGAPIDAARMIEAGRVAQDSVDPPSDLHGTAEYRRALLAALVERALERAVARDLK